MIKKLLSEPLSCDDDVVQAGEVLDLFCQWTRARMNKKKTKALGLGNWRHRSQWPLTWLESLSTLSLLGIKFSPSIVETADRVWKDAFGHFYLDHKIKIRISQIRWEIVTNNVRKSAKDK